LLALLLRGNFVYVSTTFRRRAVERIGGFDARCFCEDYELWLRFAAAGYRIARTPGPLAIYRDRVDSKSSDERRDLEGLRAMLQLVLAEYDLDDGLRSLVERRIASIDRQLYGRGPQLERAVRALAKRLLRPYLLRRTPPPEVAAVLEATARSSM
jgi:GT2 family glycosyltransferase